MERPQLKGTTRHSNLLLSRRGWSVVLVITSLFASQVTPQTIEILPGDNIIAEGIPKIPALLRMSVNRYRSFYSSSLLGWDPIKRAVIISKYQLSSLQAAVVTAPGESPAFFSRFPEGIRYIYYHPGGKYFIYRKDVNGNEVHQIYRYDIESHTSTLLTDGQSRNYYPIWSNSGQWLMYSSTRRNGKDMDVYAVNPLEPKSDHLVAKTDGTDWAAFDWSPDDRKVILSDYKSADETYLWLADVATGEKTLLTPRTGREKTSYGGFAQFSRDGRGIYITTDRDSEFRRLAYLDLKTKKTRYLTNDINWDVEEFQLSPDRTQLAFVVNEDGKGRLHMIDTTTGKEQPLPEPAIGLVSSLSWHRNGRDLGFVFTSWRNPGEAYSVDTKTGKIERWTRGFNAIDTESFSEPQQIKWTSFDGRMISGYLVRPPEKFAGKRPVIIDLHGGHGPPFAQFRPGFRGEDNYCINELGIAAIYPNVRGSSGYGKAFMRLDNGYGREGATRDIGALLDWIKTQPYLDSERVLVQGSSYGGYLALSAAASYNDRISATLSYLGPTSLVLQLENDLLPADEMREEYGDERDPKMRTFLEKIAPLNNCDKIRKPVFIIQGKNDRRVPYKAADQMVAALKKQGTPAWYLLAVDEGHGFASPRTYEYMFLAKVIFARNHLLNDSR
ncbi:MAG TPA: prolyl oligopeptidase family serine peptidase [Blastocatellia bacterium]|nr:prolyl oligopeptidase family serine peptidase [Blastocatellia bacterium]